MNGFTPLNSLESALVEAKGGRILVPQLLRTLLTSVLCVPSATEVNDEGEGFEPLIFPRENMKMFACFSDKARIGDFSSLTPYVMTMKGSDVLSRIPDGYGMVLNPGQLVGFELLPEGLAEVVADMASILR